MADTRDPDWNWVKARAACSAVAMFERLRAGALANVADTNALHQPGQPADRFKVNDQRAGARQRDAAAVTPPKYVPTSSYCPGVLAFALLYGDRTSRRF